MILWPRNYRKEYWQSFCQLQLYLELFCGEDFSHTHVLVCCIFLTRLGCDVLDVRVRAPHCSTASHECLLAGTTHWLFSFVSARAVPTMSVTVANHGYKLVNAFAEATE
jgi:hypothetical protein